MSIGHRVGSLLGIAFLAAAPLALRRSHPGRLDDRAPCSREPGRVHQPGVRQQLPRPDDHRRPGRRVLGDGHQRQRQQRPDAAQRRPGQLGAGSGRPARRCRTGPSPGKVWAPEVIARPARRLPALLHAPWDRTRRSSASASPPGRSPRARSPTTATSRWSARKTRAARSTPTRFVDRRREALPVLEERRQRRRGGHLHLRQRARCDGGTKLVGQAEAAVQAGPVVGGRPGRGTLRLGGPRPVPPVLLGQRLRLRMPTPSATPSRTAHSDPSPRPPDPVLTSNEVAAGPGHCALFAHDGRVWMVYHAWTPVRSAATSPAGPCGSPR